MEHIGIGKLCVLLGISLSTNVIELMTVFCAKLYGRRSHKNKLINESNNSYLKNQIIHT